MWVNNNHHHHCFIIVFQRSAPLGALRTNMNQPGIGS
jgi:hypothetical protein